MNWVCSKHIKVVDHQRVAIYMMKIQKCCVFKWSSYIGIGISIGVFFIADILVIGILVNLLIGAPLPRDDDIA